MALLRYLAAFLPAGVAWIVFEALFRFPEHFFPLLAAWLLLLVSAHVFLGRGDARTFAHWQFAIPSAALVCSGAAYVLFLESAALRQVLALVIPLLVAVTFWNVYLFLYQPLRYQANSLEHLSLLANLLTVFFSVTSLFGLRTYLAIPAWLVLLAVFLLAAVLVQQSFWVSKIPYQEARPYVFLLPFVVGQCVVVLMGLPMTYMVSGAATAIVYYVFLGIARTTVRKTYTARAGKRYALITFISLVVLFATAQWS